MTQISKETEKLLRKRGCWTTEVRAALINGLLIPKQ